MQGVNFIYFKGICLAVSRFVLNTQSLAVAVAAALLVSVQPALARVIEIYTFNGPSRKAPKPVVTDSLAGYPNLKVGDVTWASVNIDDSGEFAEEPDMYTKFYQWNRSTAWAATGTIPHWTETEIDEVAWTINPCPTGWRLPTLIDFEKLQGIGSVWVNANARGNDVAGRFYGPNHASCSLATDGSMNGCIFLPAVGVRTRATAVLYNQGDAGHYWSSTQCDYISGYHLNFSIGSSNSSACNDKTYGHSVRCVK